MARIQSYLLAAFFTVLLWLLPASVGCIPFMPVYYGPAPPCDSDEDCGDKWYCNPATEQCEPATGDAGIDGGSIDRGSPDVNGDTSCEPMAYYGPAAPCEGDQYCQDLHGAGWYCQDNFLDDGCGGTANWPFCVEGDGDAGTGTDL